MNFAPGKIPLRSNSRRKCIPVCSLAAQVRAKHCAKFGWLPLSDVGNEAKTRKTLKLAGVPQTTESISAAGRSSPYCGYMWRRYCCLTIFSDCRYVPYLQRHSPTKFCDGAQTAIFLAIFCVLHFQRAACSTFQTCILNSH